MNDQSFGELLRNQINEHALLIDESVLAQLDVHFELLLKWNRVHNLTTITNVGDAVLYHYMDCILGLDLLAPTKDVTDAGSGGGFPGLVAAALWPERQINLVEASAKKCAFLRLAKAEMGLDNVTVENARMEALSQRTYIMTRATFSPQTFSVVAKAMAPGGHLAVWTAVFHVEQQIIAEASKSGLGLESRKTYSLKEDVSRAICVFAAPNA